MDNIKGDGTKSWVAEGKIDGELTRVWLYNEHRRAIDKAGYEITWGQPRIVVIDAPTVALVEADNGRRRVGAVLKHGTEDEWIEVKQRVQ